MDISPGKPLPVLLQNASEEDRRRVDEHEALLERVGRIQSVALFDDAGEPPAAAIALLGKARLLVPLKGIIDVDAELARLDKQLGKLRADLARSEAKLKNRNFVNNAPAEVVEQEQQRTAEWAQKIGQLEEQRARLDELAD